MWAYRYLKAMENNEGLEQNETLGQFLKSRHYSNVFQTAYLVRYNIFPYPF